TGELGDGIGHHEADVVACILVLWTRVSKADNQALRLRHGHEKGSVSPRTCRSLLFALPGLLFRFLALLGHHWFFALGKLELRSLLLLNFHARRYDGNQGLLGSTKQLRARHRNVRDVNGIAN